MWYDLKSILDKVPGDNYKHFRKKKFISRSKNFPGEFRLGKWVGGVKGCINIVPLYAPHNWITVPILELEIFLTDEDLKNLVPIIMAKINDNI